MGSLPLEAPGYGGNNCWSGPMYAQPISAVLCVMLQSPPLPGAHGVDNDNGQGGAYSGVYGGGPAQAVATIAVVEPLTKT